MSIPAGLVSHFVDIETAYQRKLRIHYQSCGEGKPVLLLHGWPSSSYLWRKVMPGISQHHWVIAPDLPGFGQSEKPLDVRYSFRFYSNALNGLLNALKIDKVGLVVHDLGGPVGIFWAIENPSRLSALAILNTLVYPEMFWAVKLFMLGTFLPGVKNWLVSPSGIKAAFKLGVCNTHRITNEMMQPYQSPFVEDEARRALLKSAQGLSPKGFDRMASKLPDIKVPVRLIYGENDRILPDIARTMARLQLDIPHSELSRFPDCGHFLQEDEPEKLGRLLNEFFFRKQE